MAKGKRKEKKKEERCLRGRGRRKKAIKVEEEGWKLFKRKRNEREMGVKRKEKGAFF